MLHNRRFYQYAISARHGEHSLSPFYEDTEVLDIIYDEASEKILINAILNESSPFTDPGKVVVLSAGDYIHPNHVYLGTVVTYYWTAESQDYSERSKYSLQYSVFQVLELEEEDLCNPEENELIAALSVD